MAGRGAFFRAVLWLLLAGMLVCLQSCGAESSITFPDRGNREIQRLSSKDEGQSVWITETGSKYHISQTCSGSDDQSCVTKEEAEAMGFEPCKRCTKEQE